MNTETKYLGLNLKSPIIAGSCGITANLRKLQEIEATGVGAVVLKSLFEEQIQGEINKNSRTFSNYMAHPDAYDYIQEFSHSDLVGNYLTLITDAKKALNIPVIASVNCVSASDWLTYARKMEDAGADAIELNAFVLPADVKKSDEDLYAFYEDLIQIVNRAISIPFSLKVSTYFTSLAKTMQKYSWMGLSGLTLFNKFYAPDIDIHSEKIIPANPVLPSSEFYNTLRWTAILSQQIRCDISATTGVSNGDDVIKLLLAGAKTVQVVSAMYRNGVETLADMQGRLQEWMKEKNYKEISDFGGKLAHTSSEDTSTYYRIQFMKYYAEADNAQF